MAISGIHRGQEQDQTLENSFRSKEQNQASRGNQKGSEEEKKNSDCNHGARD
jgi:hypothetical protein